MESEKYAAPALDRGLSVLEYLSKSGRPRSPKEIAEGIGQKPDAIYRMLVVLERRGYIVRDEKSGTFRLSLRIYHLAHSYAPLETLRHIALEPMDELAEAIGHSCHLSILFEGKALILAHSRSTGPVSLLIEEGSVFPLVRTASGRVLLAFSTEEDRNTIVAEDSELQQMPKRRRETFLSELHDIRERRYCVSASEITRGVTDSSTVVGFEESSLIAALAVSRITSDITLQVTDEYILEQLLQTAAKIDARLGAHPGL